MSGIKNPNNPAVQKTTAGTPSGFPKSNKLSGPPDSASAMTEKETLEGIQKEVAAGTYYRDENKVADKLIRNFLTRS